VAIEGGCHCGNITFVFEASTDLGSLGLRACQCGFCRHHNARTTSDPKGTMRIRVREPEKLQRYCFGLKISDFLICKECGVFVGAVMDEGGVTWMTVNANTFNPPPPADFPVTPMDFSNEREDGRKSRRRARWTPVTEFREGTT
jgi:hypothetical protein